MAHWGIVGAEGKHQNISNDSSESEKEFSTIPKLGPASLGVALLFSIAKACKTYNLPEKQKITPLGQSLLLVAQDLVLRLRHETNPVASSTS